MSVLVDKDKFQRDDTGMIHRLTRRGGHSAHCGIVFDHDNNRREWANCHEPRCPICFDGVFTVDGMRIEDDKYENIGSWYVRRGEVSLLDLSIRLAEVTCGTCQNNGDPCLGGDRLCETSDGSLHPLRERWIPIASDVPKTKRDRLEEVIRIAQAELKEIKYREEGER